MDSLIFDTVVGLVFVFAVFTFAVSGVVEGLTRLVGLRAEFLLRGVSSLLSSQTSFDKNWIPKLVDATLREEADSAKQRVADAAAALAADNPARAEVFAALDAAIALLAAGPPDPDQPPDTTAADAALATAKAKLAGLQAAVDALPADDPARPGKVDEVEAATAALAPAEYGIRLVKGDLAAVSVVSVVNQPIVDLTEALHVPRGLRSSGKNPDVLEKLHRWRTKRQLPSYMSSRTFSAALLRTLVPSPIGGDTTVSQLKDAVDRLGDDKIADPKLRAVLKTHLDGLAEGVGKPVDEFRTRIEEWYDDHMKRVSGWYKRHTRWYTLVVAAVLAIGFNVNAVAMARALYADQALRESVVTAAFSAADCTAQKGAGQTGSTTETPAECLQDVRNQIKQLRGTGLPIGWSENTKCLVVGENGSPITGKGKVTCAFLDKIGITDPTHVDTSHVSGKVHAVWLDGKSIALVLLGWAIIAIASLLGARFWFDVLSRLGSLRSSGPKPESTT